VRSGLFAHDNYTPRTFAELIHLSLDEYGIHKPTPDHDQNLEMLRLAAEQAFRRVFETMLENWKDLSVGELLNSISFQIIGRPPHQELVIRCGEAASAVALPSKWVFYEEELMRQAEAERAKASLEKDESTGKFKDFRRSAKSGLRHKRGSPSSRGKRR
jgi:hypothetical protein